MLTAALAGAAIALGRPAWAASGDAVRRAEDFWLRPRRLRLRHASGDSIEATYWSDGELVTSEYTRLSYFLGDRVTGTGVYIQPVLLDILYGVNGWLTYFGIQQPILVTSAYRDPRRNATIEGAALNSHHTTGGAADIRIPGVSTLQVARFGQWLGGGGVGWYPSKDFTHVDRGRLRSWRG